jgi:hypothetical protein
MKLLMFTDSKTARVCILNEQKVDHKSIKCNVYEMHVAKNWLTKKTDIEDMSTSFFSNYDPVALVFDASDEEEIKERVFGAKFRSKLICREVDDKKVMEERLQAFIDSVLQKV